MFGGAAGLAGNRGGNVGGELRVLFGFWTLSRGDAPLMVLVLRPLLPEEVVMYG